VLRRPEMLAANLIRQMLMFATGSEPHYSDRREIARILDQTRADEYGVRSLIEAIVQSDLFLTK
jgi:hypothetical protein